MVNDSTNIVDNICIWDGNFNTWQPPSNYLMLAQATTPSILWLLNNDKTAYVLTEIIGSGSIGFTWNGTAVITNQDQPIMPTQPKSNGLKTA